MSHPTLAPPAPRAVPAPGEIADALRRVAGRFGGPARETILLDNFGKHLLELGMILGAPGGAGRVVDVGGGVGVNLLCLAELGWPGERLCLVDRFEEYTESNKMGPAATAQRLMRGAGIRVVSRDVWREPELPLDDGDFDVATIFDVVEHLPGHPLRQLREMHRVLKTGGTILLSGPNARSLLKRAYMLAGRHPYMAFESWMSDAYYSHFREYTPPEYAELLRRAGFEPARPLLTTEPWRTRALKRYHKGPHRVSSPILWAVVGMWLAQAVFPGLRESVYCTAEKK